MGTPVPGAGEWQAQAFTAARRLAGAAKITRLGGGGQPGGVGVSVEGGPGKRHCMEAPSSSTAQLRGTWEIPTRWP